MMMMIIIMSVTLKPYLRLPPSLSHSSQLMTVNLRQRATAEGRA